MSTANPTTEVDALFDQSMKLTPEQRRELSERLLLSVPLPSQTPVTETEWAAEIKQRIQAHETDPSSSIPLEEALEGARRIANETS